jgi:glycosyltransferase involved in cell wall biosynthesis
VVPCHAAARTVPSLLECLREQTLDPAVFEILLVDPGADGTRRVIEQRLAGWSGAEVRVVPSPLAGGPAVKRNVGAAAARAGLLAFTDADCLPEPRWLEAGLRAHRDGHDVVQGYVLPPEGARPGPFSHWVGVDDDHGLFESANIFYERELLLSLGGFSTRYYRRYGMPFGEDAELGWRALRAGARFRLEPAAVVRHPVGPPTLRGHLREQWLARGFPDLAGEVPELRERLFYRRWFLSRDSARFAAAAVGLGCARRLPAAGALGLPYAASVGRTLVRSGFRAAAAKPMSDAVLFAGLLWGSARARRLVL